MSCLDFRILFLSAFGFLCHYNIFCHYRFQIEKCLYFQLVPFSSLRCFFAFFYSFVLDVLQISFWHQYIRESLVVKIVSTNNKSLQIMCFSQRCERIKKATSLICSQEIFKIILSFSSKQFPSQFKYIFVSHFIKISFCRLWRVIIVLSALFALIVC